MKAEVLIATHTTSPHVVVLYYCLSAFWRCVPKGAALKGISVVVVIGMSSDILAFGCDYRNIMLSK